MNGFVLFAIIPVLLCVTRPAAKAIEGVCWMKINKNGYCTDLLSKMISKEECCKNYPGVRTGWSHEMDSKRLFFGQVYKTGVPCLPCKETCRMVNCGPEKKCVVRSGRPKCVCSPCKKTNSSGIVCGSDGNTYSNVCSLKKRACQRGKSDLTVAYTGYCQSSCERIKCPKGKYCLLDQNLSPHCVTCMIRCAKNPENANPVCGANGVTYPNNCVLRQKACMSGKAIPLAYTGRCKARATCSSVRCKDRQTCLTDPSSGLPRCVTCNRAKCRPGISRELGRPICGTNNKTYHSWCHLIKDACATGFVIETKFQGPCEQDKLSSDLVPLTIRPWLNASRIFSTKSPESPDPQ